MPKADPLLEPIATFCRTRGGIMVRKTGRGYSLFSTRTGGPIARLRPTGEADEMQVLWWNGERWATPGDFGPVIMSLKRALDYIVSEPAFWIHA